MMPDILGLKFMPQATRTTQKLRQLLVLFPSWTSLDRWVLCLVWIFLFVYRNRLTPFATTQLNGLLAEQ